MKRISFLFATLISGGLALAQPIPLYQNFGTVTNAERIDALAFDNHGTFNIETALPYDMQNVINFTNSGVMDAAGGFKFDTVTYENGAGGRRPAAEFVNSGIVRSDSFFGGFFFGNLGSLLGFSQSAYIFVNATNIDGRNGTFAVGSPGLLNLKGKNVDVTRSSLIAGDPFSGGGGGVGFFINDDGTNYYTLPSDITDIYGGAGVQTNNIDPDLGNFGLIPPDIFSPSHRVFFPGGGTNGTFVSVPQSFPTEFEAFANVDTAGGDKLVQVAFVKTNFFDTNVSVEVTFGPNFLFNPNIAFPGAPAAVVKIRSSSYDSITGGISTNTVTFIDSSAQQTNLVMFTNFNARQNVRPSSYQITTADIGGFGLEGNTPYDPALIFDPAIHSSNIVVGFYGGYGAQIGSDPTGSTGAGSVHPTNQSPRIEIDADNLDLTLTRVRSEGPVLIKTKHLVGNQGVDISAGLFRADIGSTNGSLRIANLFPSNFQRLRGEVYAYSYIWENVETDPDAGTTNNVKYHILILDHEFTANIVPSVESLILRAPNLIIEDDLKLDRTIRFEAQNLTLNSEITFANFDVRSTNFVGLRNFTNESGAILSGADDLKLGFDTANGLASIVNRGQIRAVAPLFKSDTFFNSGTIESGNNAFFGLTGGPIVIEAGTAEISSPSTPAELRSDQNIQITARTLMLTNSILKAGINTFIVTNFMLVTNIVFDEDLGMDVEVISVEEIEMEIVEHLKGKLILDVSNSLSDGTFTLGSTLHNFWQVTDGFSLLRKPASGDLYGTQIETIATTNSFAEIRHLWAGLDRGPIAAGYLNNATLGRLDITLLSSSALMRFSGTGSANALYVDHLEINNPSGFDITQSVVIDSNLKIYYRTSNQGDLMAQLYPNRFVQYSGAVPAATASRIVVLAKGLGIVSPNLNGKQLSVGRKYSVRAKAARGHIFEGWSGGAVSADSKLGFVMQPNLVLEANFVPNPFNNTMGTYNGLFSETNGVSHAHSGFITFKMTKNGMFTGKIIIGRSYPFRGQFDYSGFAEVSVRRPKQEPINLRLQLDLTGETDQVIGTVGLDGLTAPLLADRANAGDALSAAEYTLSIPGSDDPAVPEGEGVGTVSVDADGNLRLKGTLADGSRFNQKTGVSKNGQWPLYVPLYRGSGSISGWVTFTNESTSVFGGELRWIKNPGSTPGNSNGFTNLTTVTGASN